MNFTDNQEDKNKMETILGWGADLTAGLVGTAIELSISGASGILLAGVSTPIVSRVLQSDLVMRQLSQRQQARTGSLLHFAAQTVKWNIDSGKELRKDDYFRPATDDRSTAEEIVEGIIIAAQQEHAEKKLQLYGRLLANIAFRPDIDRPLANQLIGFARQLSYRQLCFLGLMQTHYEKLLAHPRSIRKSTEHPLKQQSIKLDIYDLLQRGILRNTEHPLNQLDFFEFRTINLAGTGTLLVELMQLEETMVADRELLFSELP